MYLTVDTSALIAVISNEEKKQRIIDLTVGYSLYAPASVHWEIGNAFSAMFKRRKIDLDTARYAVQAYQQIPIRFVDIALEHSIELAHRFDIYAYDAYLIQCALQTGTSLLTLDEVLSIRAEKAGVECIEV